MKEGFDTFGQGIDLAKYAMTGYPGVFAFAGIGILATVVMQSSHATLVLILTALATSVSQLTITPCSWPYFTACLTLSGLS